MGKSLRIVFMGTPSFAVGILDAIVQSTHQVVGVVTAPDKPSGRGLQVHESEVKKRAMALSVPIFQPTKLRDESFLESLRQLQADLFVVVAFRMMPEVLWSIPPLGAVNLHASLLPKYRGAAPIQHALWEGETKTGLTTFFIQQEIDTGKMIFQQEVAITPEETGGSLHDKLMLAGAELMVKTLDAIATGSYPQIEQNGDEMSKAPKIFREDCQLDCSQSVIRLDRQIRALNPYPTAFILFEDKSYKIFRANPVKCEVTDVPGSWVTDGKKFLHIICSDGYLEVKELQPQGKRNMSVEEFLRGWRK
jgi:methionyl-tRNA formyltransferase